VTLYDRGAFEQAHVRLRSAPGELTMADVEQLATFGGADLGREALAARKAALFPAPAVPAPAQAVNRGGLSEASIDAIAEGVVTFLAEHIRPILARLRAIEQDRDKGVGNVRWRGVFKQGEHFRSGELATHRGSLWACRHDTTQTPGRPPDADTPLDWVSIVKTGKDLG
jgi:hypothetical protein